MSTIGEREAIAASKRYAEDIAARRERAQKERRREAWRDRADMAKAAGCAVGALGIVLATAFGLVYLLALAVRLAWGAS